MYRNKYPYLNFYFSFHLFFSLQYRENCLAAKALFSDFCLPALCLQTQLLPYLTLLTIPMRNQGNNMDFYYSQEVVFYNIIFLCIKSFLCTTDTQFFPHCFLNQN